MTSRLRIAALVPLLPLVLYACDTQVEAPAVELPTAEEAESDAEWSARMVGDMAQLVSTRTAYADLNPLEDSVADVTAGLLDAWESAFESGNLPAELAARLDGAGIPWQASGNVTRTTDGIQEQAWDLDGDADSDTTAWLAGFQQVDDLMLDVVKAAREGEQLVLTVRVDVRGLNPDGQRRNDRAHVELVAEQTDGAWKLVDGQVFDAERLVATRSPAFADVTKAWGLDVVPVSDRKEAIRRGGYALAVVDYDGDAKPDMLVGNYGPVQLLKNTGSGYTDVTSQAGLAEVGVVKSAAFADLDGDGDRDLALLRFVEDDGDPIGDFVAYENQGDGTFVERKDVLKRERIYDRAMPLALGDFNSDGRIDIYVGFPGVRDFTSGISNRTREASLASQGIWYNEGGWAFTESSDSSLVVQQNQVYAHAALSSDIDGDGSPEIIVVDDSGRVNPIYRVKSDATGWEQINDDLGVDQGGMSMGVSTADFNGDGMLDIMATNITLTAGQRLSASAAELDFAHPGLKENFRKIADGYHSVLLYQNQGNGKFVEVTDQAGLAWAGEAAAAGEWLDYNHDGLLDYYLPNGLWTSGDQDLDSVYMRAELSAYEQPLYEGLGHPQAPTDPLFPNDVHGGSDFSRPLNALEANPILKLLRGHETAGKLSYSLGGNERNRLWRNNGDGTFTEVGYLEGADNIEDGYIAAPVDIDGDGRQDLVLRNTDPAPQHSYSPVQVLHNQLQGNAVTLSLTPAAGGTAIGARVTAWVGGTAHTREVRSVNGAVQAEPVAYVGLGDATQVDKVEIRWPDGHVQTVAALAAGKHTVVHD